MHEEVRSSLWFVMGRVKFLINFLSLPSKPFCVKVWDSQKGALSFDS